MTIESTLVPAELVNLLDLDRPGMVAFFAGKSIAVNVNGKKTDFAIGRKKPEGGFDARQADAILDQSHHQHAARRVDL